MHILCVCCVVVVVVELHVTVSNIKYVVVSKTSRNSQV